MKGRPQHVASLTMLPKWLNGYGVVLLSPKSLRVLFPAAFLMQAEMPMFEIPDNVKDPQVVKIRSPPLWRALWPV